MHIQSIQSNTNFKSKPRFVNSNLRKGMLDLKRNMEAETIILKTKTSNQTINVRSIEIKDEAVFKNGKFLAKRDKNNKLIPYGENTSMIEFNRVRILAHDSGEIIECKKPFYKSWTKIMQQAADYIQLALDNYNNFNIVKKITQKKENLTLFGKQELQNEYNKIMDDFNKLNPWSKK